MSEWKFKRDTAFRKQFFVPDSFAHPAKMDAQLLIRIVETYTKPGEVILDPMAGSGTLMLACTLGRNVVLVELEEKFCKMCRDNWEIVMMHPQLGYEMGDCQIIQGDARSLEGICDKIITSPPYANDNANLKARQDKSARSVLKTTGMRAEELAQNNIGQLPYGNIDAVITSPPYEASDISQTHMTSNKRGDPDNPNYRPSWKRKLAEGYADTKRPYHGVDHIITSPPYEGMMESGRHAGGIVKREDLRNDGGNMSLPVMYAEQKENIGNLKGDTYLSAMLRVYQQCFKVLKPSGLMILVTKNFIRNKKEIRLDEDTIKLCQEAGFKFLERHYRKLPAQSFWRTIYKQKYPDAPEITHEDILIFEAPTVREK
jgi:DNA modification methylase